MAYEPFLLGISSFVDSFLLGIYFFIDYFLLCVSFFVNSFLLGVCCFDDPFLLGVCCFADSLLLGVFFCCRVFSSRCMQFCLFLNQFRLFPPPSYRHPMNKLFGVRYREEKQQNSYPRNWRLYASCCPNRGSLSNPSDHPSTIILRGLRGLLNQSPNKKIGYNFFQCEFNPRQSPITNPICWTDLSPRFNIAVAAPMH